MLESLSNKVAGRPEGLEVYLKETSALLFTCEISKFLKTSIFREHHWRLFLCLSNDKTDTTEKCFITIGTFQKDVVLVRTIGRNSHRH